MGRRLCLIPNKTRLFEGWVATILKLKMDHPKERWAINFTKIHKINSEYVVRGAEKMWVNTLQASGKA